MWSRTIWSWLVGGIGKLWRSRLEKAKSAVSSAEWVTPARTQRIKMPAGEWTVLFWFFVLLAVLGFELKASRLLSNHSTM
jgi:hypothetical protein